MNRLRTHARRHGLQWAVGGWSEKCRTASAARAHVRQLVSAALKVWSRAGLAAAWREWRESAARLRFARDLMVEAVDHHATHNIVNSFRAWRRWLRALNELFAQGAGVLRVSSPTSAQRGGVGVAPVRDAQYQSPSTELPASLSLKERRLQIEHELKGFSPVPTAGQLSGTSAARTTAQSPTRAPVPRTIHTGPPRMRFHGALPRAR
uniref:Uncharacterized protein n=1 Tax=Haptolina ericina TaxID=156174 RepID=A0A7S3FIN6_9EUKA|mmetsp:Transcript_73294/g.162752  ORF Transcript_73294/g.162752 Transcript_73294/m.162752 type:complete len:207 (+) Transcript_73294:2-622(+)